MNEGWMSLGQYTGRKTVRHSYRLLQRESIFAPPTQRSYLKKQWMEIPDDGFRPVRFFETYEVYEPSGVVWEQTYEMRDKP